MTTRGAPAGLTNVDASGDTPDAAASPAVPASQARRVPDDSEPLAAASIAQVHTATLHDGTRVVVKVQRPGIARDVEAHIRSMPPIARLIEHSQESPARRHALTFSRAAHLPT